MPAVIVLGGSDDGKIFLLKHDRVRIGRIDSERLAHTAADTDVLLSGTYTAVTRVSKPHAVFVQKDGAWYIEDSGSTGGTELNNRRLEKNVPVLVQDGDLIELAKGVSWCPAAHDSSQNSMK